MARDAFRIDSHKLLLHPRRVADWLEGEAIYPLYMELSPAGACNHRCRFCGLDFAGYRPDFMDADILGQRLAEMGRLGVKSIMYAGEGEPFMHRRMADIVRQTKQAGIDCAITTNAVLMKPAVSEAILGDTSWIKVSLNAGSPETYAAVHGTKARDFDTVMGNLEAAVAIRARQGAACTLGAQILLLPENAAEIPSLAGRCRDLGLDYLVVKPYSQHPQGEQAAYKDIVYGQYAALAEEVNAYATDAFSVVFRLDAMRAWDAKRRRYDRCRALPFWSYVDSRGNVWGCSVYLGDERFRYGNIFEETFEAIWTGEKRAASLGWCAESLDPAACRVNCRMDKINDYLWELRHPNAHVNFI